MPKRFYVTTPIYYVNSVPHIGTALTTFAADVTARFRKMKGEDVVFLTGTDENALKVLEAAQTAGQEPMQFVDGVSEEFRRIWTGMKIEYDDFIRTTEPRHVETVQRVFDLLREKGYIYSGTYEGWYDVSSETFYKESDLVEGKSPDGNEVRWVQEENFFFKLSAFEDRLLAHIEANPTFIQPETRKNEVVSFVKQGLRDASVSRANPGWGIPIPGDDSKVIYVWFDALINYLSATGWPNAGWEEFWPIDVQWMGKDILTRFHATLWPALLMGLDLPLPTTLIGHGWMTFDGVKISKSKGNAVPPLDLAAKLVDESACLPDIAIDAVRYYMAATMPYESDTTFSYDDFNKRYNNDLANDLGNALNRSLAMAHKFVEGRIPAAEVELDALAAIKLAKERFASALERYRIDESVEAAWGLVRFLNKYIDNRAPWALAKAGDHTLAAVMRSMLFALRSCEGMIRPLMPSTADAIASQLGCEPLVHWEDIGEQASLPAGIALQPPTPIFPRLETKKETKNVETPKAEPSQPVTPNAQTSEISIEEFAKIEFRVGRVLEAEALEGADKLLKLQVVIGSEKRQIVAGIRKNYDPLDLIGRQVVVVANLKPAMLRGTQSQGMLLAAVDSEGGAILLQPEKEAPEGAKVR